MYAFILSCKIFYFLQTDTHYSLLMLLLSIGENPTHATYIEKPKILKAPGTNSLNSELKKN